MNIDCVGRPRNEIDGQVTSEKCIRSIHGVGRRKYRRESVSEFNSERDDKKKKNT